MVADALDMPEMRIDLGGPNLDTGFRLLPILQLAVCAVIRIPYLGSVADACWDGSESDAVHVDANGKI